MLVFGLLVSGTIMNIIIQSLGDNKKGAEWRPEEKKGKSSCKITWCTKCMGCMSCSRAWQFHNKDTSTWVFKLMMQVNVLKSPIKYSWHLIHTCIAETPTSGDLKSGDSLFFHYPPPPPPLPWPSPQWEWFRTFYEVVHEVHTIKFAIIVFMPERKWLNTCKNAPETVL